MRSLAAALILSASVAHAGQLVQGQMPVSDVVVHFVTPQRFAKICPSPKDYACATVAHPCQVYLRAGVRLWGNPEDGYAGFSDPMDAAKLAHEFLHCANGSWHP